MPQSFVEELAKAAYSEWRSRADPVGLTSPHDWSAIVRAVLARAAEIGPSPEMFTAVNRAMQARDGWSEATDGETFKIMLSAVSKD